MEPDASKRKCGVLFCNLYSIPLYFLSVQVIFVYVHNAYCTAHRLWGYLQKIFYKFTLFSAFVSFMPTPPPVHCPILT
jgi:hypothetical protein